MNVYNCLNSSFFFVENNKIVKYCKDSEDIIEYENNIGIVGRAFQSREILAYDNIKNTCDYNSIIDLESSSGILAFPIISKNKKSVCAIIEVPFTGDINKLGKPKEKEIILIKNISKCIKNWIFKFNNDVK